MEWWHYVAIAIYLIGVIGCYVYEGWKNGFGNTEEDNYLLPLIWPVIVVLGIAVVVIGVPIAIIFWGIKFILDGFIFLGDALHKAAKSNKKSLTVKSRWVK